MRHRFDFDRAYRIAGLPFGVTPRSAWVEVADGRLEVRYGPLWRLRTPVSNVVSAEVTGDFAFVKTAGPPHLSFADRGVSFATNGRTALCVRFGEPVPAIDPTGLSGSRLAHPGATLSVTDPEALQSDLAAAGARLHT
jgi:hypothetical protein